MKNLTVPINKIKFHKLPLDFTIRLKIKIIGFNNHNKNVYLKHVLFREKNHEKGQR